MTRRDAASAQNLTGVWDGTYSYGSGTPSVAFVATLIESGTTLTGTTHEPCTIGGSSDEIMLATLLGVRQGQAVHYEGTLNADVTEIEGRWSIPGDGSGAFLMIRPAGASQTIARKSTAKV